MSDNCVRCTLGECMKQWTIMFVLVSIVVVSRPLAASCGSATCPLNTLKSLQSGWMSVGYFHEYIDQNQIYVGTNRSHVGAIPYDHNEVETLNERDVIQLQAGLSQNIGLSAAIPFVHRAHSHIDQVNGWEHWDFRGLGDIVLTGMFVVIPSDRQFAPAVSVSAAMQLPTGMTGAKNGAGETAEVTIQPGTGAKAGIFGINYQQAIASVPALAGGVYSTLPVTASATYQMNGAGTNGYRFGNSLVASIGTAYQMAEHASFLFQVNAKLQGYADPGATSEPRENTGGTWVYASPGLHIEINDNLSAQGFVQIPVYQNVHGIQQTAPFNLQFGIAADLDLLE